MRVLDSFEWVELYIDGGSELIVTGVTFSWK